MKMLQDYLLLQKVERKDAKIITLDSDKPQSKDIEVFLVKIVGPGRFEYGKLIPMDVKDGDLVFISGFVSVSKDGIVHTIGRAKDVIAVF